ncbi:hypothetical protein, partial [Pseudomonas sp. SF2]|uniref:hypothetical protein n=1 Tax=Pseudomonas sp. SF2 TaxID=1026793 RepID=UPI002FE346F0
LLANSVRQASAQPTSWPISCKAFFSSAGINLAGLAIHAKIRIFDKPYISSMKSKHRELP